MKKILLSLVILFLLCGAVWAQLGPTPNPGLILFLVRIPSGMDALNWEGGLFDSFYAPRVVSTESRYSAGIFGSDIDNYLDVSSYDPKIGTFFFLGAFPPGVDTLTGDEYINHTDYLSGGPSDYAISFGFAKTVNCYYFGVYYGGAMLRAAYGSYEDSGLTESYSSTLWQNNFTAIIGRPTIGAFRFDLQLNTSTEEVTVEDNSTDRYRLDPPSLALTYGGIKFGGFAPYITVGYKFGEKEVVGNTVSGSYKEGTYNAGGKLGVQAGVSYAFSGNSSISADVSFVKLFADKYSGDDEIVGGYKPFAYDGGWGIGLKTAYKLVFGKEKFQGGISPGIAAAYIRDPYRFDPWCDYLFELSSGLDLGLKYQHCPKFAFYTGASLQFFDWVLMNRGSADDKGWFFDGLRWDGRKWADPGTYSGSYLGFGLTFTPIKNLIIGTGLNTLIDRLFIVDFSRMTVESGDFFNSNSPNNVGTWFGNLFREIKLDLTISYKF